MIRKRFIVILMMLTAIAFGVLALSPTLAQAVTTPEDFTPEAEVFVQVSPSVVSLTVSTAQGGGAGSGFVIDQQGHIVTNNHVVDGAQFIEVEFIDGTLAEGRIIGLDPDSDIAVIRVELPPERLQPITWGDSDTLFIGQPVVAIGSPFRQEFTLTSGLVSALDRTIQGLTGFSIGGVIQTDAAINPGNSGGPLLNLRGEVVGVNSQILSSSRSNSGVGFSVPSNLTRRVAQELIENGFVSYSYLGIRGGDVNLRLMEQLNLPDNVRGVVVSEATRGGPAARAGLRNPEVAEPVSQFDMPDLISADIITAVNGTSIRGMDDLIAYLAQETRPDDQITLSVYRNGETVNLTVDLIPRPSGGLR